MKKPFFTRIVLLVCSLAPAWAQEPVIGNAKLTAAPVSQGLGAAIRRAISSQPGPLWIGYSVPGKKGTGESCCWNRNERGCRLEGKPGGSMPASQGPVKLEGATNVTILLRAEQGAVGKIQALSEDCALDAGGLPLVWLAPVKPSESVAVLAQYAAAAEPEGKRSKVEGVLHAIAMHEGAEADAALDKLASSGTSEAVRKSALFWLANSRGKEGFDAVARAVRQDPSDKVREHAIFALTQSTEPQAIPTIIRVAKEDKSPHVRGQALFWLAQRASKELAAQAIGDVIEQDAETGVKKKAVFALTQIPNDEGVPLLIQIAKSNRSPAVRKQAMFWLGQSKDARALAFFENVLAK